jgi:D-hexose-6-phosphate mutarotase
LPADPDYIHSDIENMARYYAQYAEVRQLFSALEFDQWTWQYGKKSAETQMVIANFRVNSAVIILDTRGGAQFKFQKMCEQRVPYCYIAPADVMLHELLHVYSAVKNTSEFIAQGGLSQQLYPYRHEAHVIDQERELYRAMSAQDKIPRPQRNEHTGKFSAVACATCLR